MTTRRIIASLALASTLALAACGAGGGGGGSAPAVNGFLAAPKANVSFSVRVPIGATTSSASRQAKYISAATQSVTFTLTQWNANPETVAPVVVALTGANCTGTGTAKVCTVTSSAPVGNDVWDVKTYSTAGGTGTPLSAAISVNANITQPGPNNISTTLYGVVSSLNFSPASAACLDGTACSGAVTLTARDPSNATIIGPGNNLLTPALGFDSVRLTCQAHLAAQSSSGAAVAQPYYAPAAIDLGKIAYDGVSLGASGGTLTCTAADSATATATFTLTTAATGSATWTLN